MFGSPLLPCLLVSLCVSISPIYILPIFNYTSFSLSQSCFVYLSILFFMYFIMFPFPSVRLASCSHCQKSLVKCYFFTIYLANLASFSLFLVFVILSNYLSFLCLSSSIVFTLPEEFGIMFFFYYLTCQFSFFFHYFQFSFYRLIMCHFSVHLVPSRSHCRKGL